MTSRPDRPVLLLLCHCVPDASGDAPRARAWQMLRLASQSHRVYLACVHDGPVSLLQWRAMQPLADRIYIESVGPVQYWLGRCLALADPAASGRFKLGHLLSRVTDEWRREQRFSTVLCLHPALWHNAKAIQASMRICDLYVPSNVQGKIHRKVLDWKWPSRRNVQRTEELARCIAREANLITVARSEDMGPYRIERSKTLLVPEAVDLKHFWLSDQGVDQERPVRLVYHADWRHGGRKMFDWFSREVWPEVHRAIPAAQLTCTRPDRLRPMDRLRSASVVLSAQTVPSLARWPILQAMALQRAVVASGKAVHGMGLGHREHVLLCRSKQDWSDLCIESLRNDSMRLKLAHAARSYVERYCSIERCGHQLIRTLLQSQTPRARDVRVVPVA